MIVLEWLETPACVFDWIGPSDDLPPLRSPSGAIVAAVVGPQGEPGEDGQDGAAAIPEVLDGGNF